MEVFLILSKLPRVPRDSTYTKFGKPKLKFFDLNSGQTTIFYSGPIKLM